MPPRQGLRLRNLLLPRRQLLGQMLPDLHATGLHATGYRQRNRQRKQRHYRRCRDRSGICRLPCRAQASRGATRGSLRRRLAPTGRADQTDDKKRELTHVQLPFRVVQLSALYHEPGMIHERGTGAPRRVIAALCGCRCHPKAATESRNNGLGEWMRRPE